MKNLRNRFERFCFRNRRKGIPNLMMYLCLGSAFIYLFTIFTGNLTLMNLLCFHRGAILQGQVWRLITFPLVCGLGNPILTLISLLCYYSLGRTIEQIWGTLRFNLFYLSGMVMMDIYCMIFGGYADVSYLNLSLFLSFATLMPDAHFLLFFIIPVKAWIFAVLDLGLTLYDVLTLSIPVFRFPSNLFPLVAIANYLLFFGKDVANVFPMSWRVNAGKLFRKKPKQAPKVVPFPGNTQYRKPENLHTHCCTVCGRTDVTNPELEFRYCSRCAGYHCFCIDHIQNHEHYE